MKIIVTVLIACLLFPISGLAETNFRNANGNDWNRFDYVAKALYLTGFFAGMDYITRNIDKDINHPNQYFIKSPDICKAMLLWAEAILVDNKSKKSKRYYNDEEVKQIVREDRIWFSLHSIDKYVIKSAPTLGQVKEGLDILYADFKNRNILLTDAIFLVKRQITGSSPEEVEAITQWLRSPDRDSKIGSFEFVDKDGKKQSVPLKGLIEFIGKDGKKETTTFP